MLFYKLFVTFSIFNYRIFIFIFKFVEQRRHFFFFLFKIVPTLFISKYKSRVSFAKWRKGYDKERAIIYLRSVQIIQENSMENVWVEKFSGSHWSGFLVSTFLLFRSKSRIFVAFQQWKWTCGIFVERNRRQTTSRNQRLFYVILGYHSWCVFLDLSRGARCIITIQSFFLNLLKISRTFIIPFLLIKLKVKKLILESNIINIEFFLTIYIATSKKIFGLSLKTRRMVFHNYVFHLLSKLIHPSRPIKLW